MPKKAFTLIEILIVITIIGILIGISIFGLLGARKNARDAKRKSDLETIRSGLELYKSDCGVYPVTLPSAGDPLMGKDATGSCLTDNEYISEVPGDDVEGRLYAYSHPLDNYSKYYLCASLEQTPTSIPGTIGNCGNCGDAEGVECNYIVTNP